MLPTTHNPTLPTPYHTIDILLPVTFLSLLAAGYYTHRKTLHTQHRLHLTNLRTLTLASEKRYTVLCGAYEFSYEHLHRLREKLAALDDGSMFVDLDWKNLVEFRNEYRVAVNRQVGKVEKQKKQVEEALEEARALRGEYERVKEEGERSWFGWVVNCIPLVRDEV